MPRAESALRISRTESPPPGVVAGVVAGAEPVRALCCGLPPFEGEGGTAQATSRGGAGDSPGTLSESCCARSTRPARCTSVADVVRFSRRAK